MTLLILPTSLILATLFACVRADGLDDFTNNLFSDLGPILSLFGERVTMQFLSQTLNWVDCIALAMAPLGIVTILVSAIRVGGPQWLKGIIGRARENTASAEMELMSSTSNEVCELFNGKSFIRCQGTAPVWEYIYIKNVSSQKELPLKFMTLQEAFEKRLLSKNGKLYSPGGDKSKQPEIEQDDAADESTCPPNTGNTTYGIWSGAKRWFHTGSPRRRKSKEAEVEAQMNVCLDNLQDRRAKITDECITVIRQDTDNAPNITLNLQKTNLRKANEQKAMGRNWINYVAGLGGFLQVGVLAVFGVISYDYRIRPDFQKDGKPAAAYGFPLAAGGTILLAAGMFICALVIENSTKEYVYEATEDHEIRVYWLQQSQTVSDQVFESFAVFPKQEVCLMKIIKSVRQPYFSDDSEHGEKLTWFQTKTIFGVSIGLLGFIIQFTGLRAMNSAASLVQLAAVAIMTGCRAFVRPGFSSNFEKKKLRSGFELDWLAWELVAEKKQKAPTGQGNGQTEFSEHPKQDKPINGFWAVLPGEYVEYEGLEPLTQEKEEETEAHKVLLARRDLCQLAKFQSQTSTVAINLAMGVETVLQTLFPDGPPKIPTAEGLSNSDTSQSQQGKGFRWLVNVTYGSSALANSPGQRTREKVWFDLEYTSDSWHVREDSLDAALSLWVYSVKEREKQQPGNSEDGDTKDTQWLRRKVPQPCLRLMDPGKELREQLLQDLEWWVPQSTEQLLEVEEVIDPAESQTEHTNTKVFHAARAVGCRPSSASNIRAQKGSFWTFPPTMQRHKGTLAIESRDLLEHLYAKDLLFSFMCSAAKTAAKAAAETSNAAIAGRAELRTAVTSDQAPKVLWQKELGKLADSFQSNGFGTDKEALISIITPFSMAGILPFPHPWLEARRDEVAADWQLGNEEDAVSICEELITKIEHYAAGNNGLYESILALMLEVLNGATYQALCLVDHAKPVYRLMPRFEERLKNRIKESVKKWQVKPEFFCEFERLFNKSGRELMAGLPPFTCNDRRRRDNSNANDDLDSHHGFEKDCFPTYFNLDPSHLLALKGSFDKLKDAFDKEHAHKRDFCGRTPLHYAAMNDGNYNSLRVYLPSKHKDVDVDVKDHLRYTPLHYACALGRDENVYVLLDWNAKLDNQGIDGMYPMHLAARNGYAKVIKTILAKEAESRLENARWKLRDYNGYLPVHWGAIKGHEEIIRQLDADINAPSAENDTPLHLAVLHGKKNVVKALLELRADMENPNKDGETALLLAFYLGNLEIAEQLIDEGANPNYVGRFGDSPLHGLFRRYYTKSYENLPRSRMQRIARCLVEKGANPHAKNNKGQTPVNLAHELRISI